MTSVLILFALHYPNWRIFWFPIWLVIAFYAFMDVAALGNAPNFDWIVSTGQASNATAADATAITKSEPGNHGANRRRAALQQRS